MICSWLTDKRLWGGVGGIPSHAGGPAHVHQRMEEDEVTDPVGSLGRGKDHHGSKPFLFSG